MLGACTSATPDECTRHSPACSPCSAAFRQYARRQRLPPIICSQVLHREGALHVHGVFSSLCSLAQRLNENLQFYLYLSGCVTGFKGHKKKQSLLFSAGEIAHAMTKTAIGETKQVEEGIALSRTCAIPRESWQPFYRPVYNYSLSQVAETVLSPETLLFKIHLTALLTVEKVLRVL